MNTLKNSLRKLNKRLSRKTPETDPLLQKGIERAEYLQSFPKVLVYKSL